MESYVIGKLDRGLKFVYRELEQYDKPKIGDSFFCWGTIVIENLNEKDLMEFVKSSPTDDCRIIENIDATTFVVSKRVHGPFVINNGIKPHVFAIEKDDDKQFFYFQFTEHHKTMINDFVDSIYQKYSGDLKIYLVANLVPLKLIFVPRPVVE